MRIADKIKGGGIDPTYYDKISKAESGGNAKAKNPSSSASGQHQFVAGTWNALSNKYNLGYTLEDRFDPVKSRKVAELYTQENAKYLQNRLGKNLTNTDLYFGHFLGAAGAERFLKNYYTNPNASVQTVATPAEINANKNIFTNKDGSFKTTGEVYNLMASKLKETPEKVTNFETTEALPILAGEKASLTSAPEPKQDPEAQKAQETLVQKQREEDFVQQVMQRNQQIAQPQEQAAPQQQAQAPAFGQAILAPYQQIENFLTQMQAGGTVQNYEQDRQWLQNWYENREIPNPAIQELYLRDKPSFLTQSQFIPDPTIVDQIDNDPQIKGQYDPATGGILMTPNANRSTYLHEATHKTQDFNSYMRPIHEALVKDNLRPQDQLTGYYNEEYNYLSDPDEVHARIQVLRNEAGLQPNEEVTPEMLKIFRDSYQNNDQNINDLFNLTDEEGLLKLLNYMAVNQNQGTSYYGKQGGKIKKNSYEY